MNCCCCCFNSPTWFQKPKAEFLLVVRLHTEVTNGGQIVQKILHSISNHFSVYFSNLVTKACTSGARVWFWWAFLDLPQGGSGYAHIVCYVLEGLYDKFDMAHNVPLDTTTEWGVDANLGLPGNPDKRIKEIRTSDFSLSCHPLLCTIPSSCVNLGHVKWQY